MKRISRQLRPNETAIDQSVRFPGIRLSTGEQFEHDGEQSDAADEQAEAAQEERGDGDQALRAPAGAEAGRHLRAQ